MVYIPTATSDEKYIQEADANKDSIVSLTECFEFRTKWAKDKGIILDCNHNLFKNGERITPTEAARLAGLIK